MNNANNISLNYTPSKINNNMLLPVNSNNNINYDELSDSFLTENLNIYISFAYSVIYLKIENKLTFFHYELFIYETDIIDENFNIRQLYIFLRKCLRKEDNHTFICIIKKDVMNLQLKVLFNSYFNINYELELEKKENNYHNNPSPKNENSNIPKNENYNPILDKIKKDYEDLVLKYNSLVEIVHNSEICIGYFNSELGIFHPLFLPINSIELNIKNLMVGFQYKIKNFQIVLYYCKIIKLHSLKKIYSIKDISISFYDDKTNTIISNSIFDEYCKSKKIEIFLL